MFCKCIYVIFFGVILSVLFNSAISQYACEDLFDNPIFNITLNTTDPIEIDSLQINDIEDAYVQNNAFIQAIVEGDTLIVKTTEHLANYEDAESFFATVIVECGEYEDEYPLVYNINFEESKCSRLHFEEIYYSYLFYDFLLSTDTIDMDNEQITLKCVENPVNFIIEENDYFAIADNGDDVDSSSSFYLNLVVLKDIYAPFDKTLTITAMDNDNRTATTTFRVEVFGSTYSELEFTEPLYFGYIDTDMKVVIENGPIDFLGSIDPAAIQIEISPAFSIFFEINYSPPVTLSVGSFRNISELIEDVDTVNLTLTAHNLYEGNRDQTTVILDLSRTVEFYEKREEYYEEGNENEIQQDEEGANLDSNNDQQRGIEIDRSASNVEKKEKQDVEEDANISNERQPDEDDEEDYVKVDLNVTHEEKTEEIVGTDLSPSNEEENLEELEEREREEEEGHEEEEEDVEEEEEEKENIEKDFNTSEERKDIDTDYNISIEEEAEQENEPNGDDLDLNTSSEEEEESDDKHIEDEINMVGTNTLGIFNFWISRSRSLIVITAVFTTTFVVSAIFYLKLKLASRRREF